MAEKKIEHNDANRGSIIIGKSAHDQRIERTRVDVYKGSLCVFHDHFTSLEASGILNINNPVHMFALHFTYRPIIQRRLDDFARAFNRHPISIEGGTSPIQLWTKGVIQSGRSTSAGEAIFAQNDVTTNNQNDQHEQQTDEPMPVLERLTSLVQLDDIECPVEPSVYRELAHTIHPLQDANHPLGLDVFENTLRLLLSRRPSNQL